MNKLLKNLKKLKIWGVRLLRCRSYNELKAWTNQFSAECFNMRRLQYQFYVKPKSSYQPLTTEEPFLSAVTELKNNGVIKFPKSFAKQAEVLDQIYLEENDYKERKQFVIDDSLGERELSNGTVHQCIVSFAEPTVREVLLDTDLIRLISDYYGRQPYYRNLPDLRRQEYRSKHQMDIAGVFHLDRGLRQVTLMLLLKDISEADTHLEYAVGSHKQELPKDLVRERLDSEQILSEHEIFHAVGEKGDLFIFDAGNGFHRGLFKTDTRRDILHVNLTTGWFLPTDKEQILSLGELSQQGYPTEVCHSMQHLCS